MTPLLNDLHRGKPPRCPLQFHGEEASSKGLLMLFCLAKVVATITRKNVSVDAVLQVAVITVVLIYGCKGIVTQESVLDRQNGTWGLRIL